jgi:hypothetical protein
LKWWRDQRRFEIFLENETFWTLGSGSKTLWKCWILIRI